MNKFNNLYLHINLNYHIIRSYYSAVEVELAISNIINKHYNIAKGHQHKVKQKQQTFPQPIHFPVTGQ